MLSLKSGKLLKVRFVMFFSFQFPPLQRSDLKVGRDARRQQRRSSGPD